MNFCFKTSQTYLLIFLHPDSQNFSISNIHISQLHTIWCDGNFISSWMKVKNKSGLGQSFSYSCLNFLKKWWRSWSKCAWRVYRALYVKRCGGIGLIPALFELGLLYNQARGSTTTMSHSMKSRPIHKMLIELDNFKLFMRTRIYTNYRTILQCHSLSKTGSNIIIQ